MRYAGPLKAVIFDWAGTTLDFGSRAPVAAVMELFRRIDLPISIENARGPMGMAKRDHLRAILDLPNLRSRWRQLHDRDPNNADVERLYQQFLPVQKEVLVAHADLVPGCPEIVDACRQRGMRIGSTTGYTRELMDVLAPIARKQGYEPDTIVCADNISPGRPAPWICLEAARRLGVFPMESLVNVDDTVVGIEAGLNAGMWTVGVATSGNLVGLGPVELIQLAESERNELVCSANRQLLACGAHFVVNTVADLASCLDEIEALLRRGDRP